MRSVAVAGLSLLVPLGAIGAQGRPSVAEDGAKARIAMEVRAFERDLAAKDWNAVLGHFWPAKITARWEPPVQNEEWIAASPAGRVPIASGSGGTTDGCGEQGVAVEMAVVGRWARVILPACASPSGELWLLEVNGRWKIVRLTLGAQVG